MIKWIYGDADGWLFASDDFGRRHENVLDEKIVKTAMRMATIISSRGGSGSASSCRSSSGSILLKTKTIYRLFYAETPLQSAKARSQFFHGV